MPERIQRKRTRGWRMPEGAVYVGRGTRWGNPFRVGSNIPTLFVHDGVRVLWTTPRDDDAHWRARSEAVRRYGLWIRFIPDAAEIETELWGHDLACWCPLDQPCHADVLLELANR